MRGASFQTGYASLSRKLCAFFFLRAATRSRPSQLVAGMRRPRRDSEHGRAFLAALFQRSNSATASWQQLGSRRVHVKQP